MDVRFRLQSDHAADITETTLMAHSAIGGAILL
jgi:hypothetical protein